MPPLMPPLHLETLEQLHCFVLNIDKLNSKPKSSRIHKKKKERKEKKKKGKN